MVKKNGCLLLASLATAMFTVSCVDDNYDLSDIDGTVGINVNELTIPLEVDSVALNQIIEIEPGDEIEEIVDANGNKIYAITERGTFESDGISVAEFVTEKPVIDKIQGELWLEPSAAGANTRSERLITDLSPLSTADDIKEFVKAIVEYEMSPQSTAINVAPAKVDEAIVSVQHLGLSGAYTVGLKFDTEDKVATLLKKLNLGTEYLRILNLRLTMPTGLIANFTLNDKDVTEYYAVETGILDLSTIEIIAPKGEVEVNIDLLGIDFSRVGDDIKFENNTFSLNGRASVASGRLVVGVDLFKDPTTLTPVELAQLGLALAGIEEECPKSILYRCTPDLSALSINEFTGEVKYDIDNLNIDPVSITNLPDFLNDDRTNIVLANPQVYLSLNNPLVAAGYNLDAVAGLAVTAERPGNNMTGPFTLDATNPELHINKASNVFCLAPAKPANMLAEFAGAQFYGFKSLANILSGNGVPTMLHIDVLNPHVPTQTVENFRLPQTFSAVDGEYYLYAPLALGANSEIIYTETLDEWYDETLEKLTINKLKVKATVDSDIPLSAYVTIKPIGRGGQVLTDAAGKEIEGKAILEAAKEGQAFEVVLGETVDMQISGLDGIIIEAHLNAGDGSPISPNQKLDITNLKVTVSGQYIDEM